MISVAVVGCGNVGRYHGLGAARSALVSTVSVFDDDPLRVTEVLELCGRYGATSSITPADSLGGLPQEIDLLIIATPSRGRLELVRELLEGRKVRFLLLEKIVEQSSERVDEIANFIDTQELVCWVNHSRRMMARHQEISDLVRLESLEVIKVNGPSWGLVTSGLHFVDLASWWAAQTAVRIDWDFDDLNWGPSKRPGYFEIDGKVEVEFDGGLKLLMESGRVSDRKHYQSSLSVSLGSAESSASFDEITGQREGFFGGRALPEGGLELQSNLTTQLVDSLGFGAVIDLPTLRDCVTPHRLFLDSLARALEDKGLHDGEILPIT